MRTNKRKTLPCTQEAKLCPDGSYVGRTVPNCEFAPCPTTAETLSVSIEELRSNPRLYNGKRIKTTGIWVSGFETNALSDSTVEQNGVVFLKQPAIWLQENPITNKQGCFTVEEFPPATFCTVNVEGVFEHGGSYGHLGGYQFQVRSER